MVEDLDEAIELTAAGGSFSPPAWSPPPKRALGLAKGMLLSVRILKNPFKTR
jgi:hypothetical protein